MPGIAESIKNSPGIIVQQHSKKEQLSNRYAFFLARKLENVYLFLFLKKKLRSFFFVTAINNNSNW